MQRVKSVVLQLRFTAHADVSQSAASGMQPRFPDGSHPQQGQQGICQSEVARRTMDLNLLGSFLFFRWKLGVCSYPSSHWPLWDAGKYMHISISDGLFNFFGVFFSSSRIRRQPTNLLEITLPVGYRMLAR